jgi:hypothetical protein
MEEEKVRITVQSSDKYRNFDGAIALDRVRMRAYSGLETATEGDAAFNKEEEKSGSRCDRFSRITMAQ